MQNKEKFNYDILDKVANSGINTFLESYDLTGKTILPFCTSGGSSIEESMPDLRQIAQSRGAVVGTGLTANSLTESEIDSWLSSNGI